MLKLQRIIHCRSSLRLDEHLPIRPRFVDRPQLVVLGAVAQRLERRSRVRPRLRWVVVAL